VLESRRKGPKRGPPDADCVPVSAHARRVPLAVPTWVVQAMLVVMLLSLQRCLEVYLLLFIMHLLMHAHASPARLAHTVLRPQSLAVHTSLRHMLVYIGGSLSQPQHRHSGGRKEWLMVGSPWSWVVLHAAPAHHSMWFALMHVSLRTAAWGARAPTAAAQGRVLHLRRLMVSGVG